MAAQRVSTAATCIILCCGYTIVYTPGRAGLRSLRYGNREWMDDIHITERPHWLVANNLMSNVVLFDVNTLIAE